jgi:hypothetical protein
MGSIKMWRFGRARTDEVNMKLLSLDDMLAVSEQLDLPGHVGYLETFEKLTTGLAEVIAKKLDVAVIRPAEWQGKEFGGLLVAFGPSTPEQPCPQVIADEDLSGVWEAK